jgi:proteasome accessory factor B
MKTVKKRRPPSEAGKKPEKAALARLLKIHDWLNDAWRNRRRVNCRILAETFEVSGKTIQRDVSYLRNRLDLPIEYDYAEKSFGYTREVPHFPLGHDLSHEERVALVVAWKSLEVFAGVGFGDELRSAFDKITGGMLAEGSGLQHESLDRYISVRTPGAGIVRDRRVFDSVRRALLNHVELLVEYQAKGRPAHTPRRLHPYHLACIENRWVLVALDADKREVRTYLLARMRHARTPGIKFERPAEFDPVKHLGTSFGAWTGRGEKIVELVISPAGAHHVLERQWHSTQQVTALAGGAVKVTFALSDLNDVTRWILGFGSDCEVLQPLELRAAIATEGKKMATRITNNTVSQKSEN